MAEISATLWNTVLPRWRLALGLGSGWRGVINRIINWEISHRHDVESGC